MRLDAIVVTAVLGLALAAPVHAQQAPESPKRDPFAQIEALLGSGTLLRGVVREEDVSLLFDHLRAALLAASQGREPPQAPEALARRGEEIAGELKVRGTAAGLVVLTVFETAARQLVRELLAAPPPPAAR